MEEFLQPAFRIVVGGIDLEVFEEFARLGEDDPAHGHKVAVEIHGTDQSLERIRERARPITAAVGFLAAAHHEVASQIEAVGKDAEAVAGDDAGADFGQVAFAQSWGN